MGQYFITINKTKKEYIDTHTFGDGAKFLEFMSSSRGMKEATMMLLTNGGTKEEYLGRWSGDQIEVLGDYAEEGNLWDEIHSEKSKWKDISKETYRALFKNNAWFATEEKEYLKKNGSQYLYTDQKVILQELFPEQMMEGDLRKKIKEEYNIK
jgi:hypothetical protein